MPWFAMNLLLYFGLLGLVLVFLAGASILNERAAAWADAMSEYYAYREWRRAA